MRSASPVAWQPDLLGPGFEQATLALGADDEGEVVATLVRCTPPTHRAAGALRAAAEALRAAAGPFRDVDVLSVHGWSDYFFHTELARFWTSRGARFYAVDLRKYGRSLRPGQTPGDIARLEDYDADIEAALAAMGHGVEDSPRRRLVLQGHSTGGLVFALWAARHRGRTAALVLNSPWLELQLGPLGRSALTPLVEARARLDPLGVHPAVDLGFYTRAQRELGVLPFSGYREDWRPERGFRTHPGWLAAVLAGHRTVAAGIDVGAPVLVLLSAASTSPIAWSDRMTHADGVLAVDEVARAATRIGSTVTIARIDDGIHDLFLSAPCPRAEAYAQVAAWIRGAMDCEHRR